MHASTLEIIFPLVKSENSHFYFFFSTKDVPLLTW